MYNILQDSTGFLFSRVCHLRRKLGGALFDEIGLYRGQHWILAALWREEGMTHSELAASLDRRPATITNMLQRMELAGLVERRRDTEDNRVSRVFLTDRGRAIRHGVERAWDEVERATFGCLDDEEQRQMRRLLAKISKSLKDQEPDRGGGCCREAGPPCQE